MARRPTKPFDPRTLATHWPRTAAALESLDCAWFAGPLPEETPTPVAQAAEALRDIKNHVTAERREALLTVAREGGELAAPLLVEAVLRDTAFELRSLALHSLAALPGRAVDGAIALGLADTRSNNVRRTASRLLVGRGAAAFAVIRALWEDDAADRAALAQELVACAERTPRAAMRPMMALLEKEARRFFQPGSRRLHFQDCARKIDAATAPLKDLPVAAGVSTDDTDLPLPASAPDAEVRVGRVAWWRRLLRL